MVTENVNNDKQHSSTYSVALGTVILFQHCCSRNNQSKCDGTDSKWLPARLTGSDVYGVTMDSPCVGQWIMGVRYAWRESPCGFKACPVYTVENDLPMAPVSVVGLIG